jgi:hypothetical protein
MLRLVNLEEIESLLLRIPTIVQKWEQHEPDFMAETTAWLSAMEEVLGRNRMTTAAEVAVLRTVLIGDQRSADQPGCTPAKLLTRKMKEARAANLLKQATQIVSDALRTRRAQVAEAERVMLQIVGAAYQLGIVQPDAGSDHTAYLQALKQAILARTELVSLAVHVLGLVGNVDFLVLLDRGLAAYVAA